MECTKLYWPEQGNDLTCTRKHSHAVLDGSGVLHVLLCCGSTVVILTVDFIA